jgi:hypothetical protein
METEYHVPTPTKRSLETDRETQLQIYTLYNIAGWKIDDIALQLNLTLRQVRKAFYTRLTHPKAKAGRRALLNTPQRKRLIEYCTQSKKTSWAPLDEIGQTLFNCGPKAIRSALKKEGYTRAIARETTSI